MAVEEFIDITGISPEHLQEIVALGWIEARTSATEAQMFRDIDIYRVRKLEHICCDFPWDWRRHGNTARSASCPA